MNDCTNENDVTLEIRKMDLKPGYIIDCYKIVKLLECDVIGKLYLVEHDVQGTLHILEVLSEDLSAIEGFVKEMQTLKLLQHENILSVNYSGEQDGFCYLVTDFVATDGRDELYSLEKALAIGKILSPATVLHIMLQICKGLKFAHNNGVAHQNLRPVNILFSSENLIKSNVLITDLGLTRVVGEKKIRGMLAQNALCSCNYISPEQEDGKLGDERSDLYALGVMMHHMLTGQRLEGHTRTASIIEAGLSARWDEIIDRCLEVLPENRFQSVSELAQELSEPWPENMGSGIEVENRFQNVTDLEQELTKKWSVNLHSGLEMVFMPIKSGSFEMGSENGKSREKPVHRVTLAKPYWMGHTAVTQAQYGLIMGVNPSSFKGGDNPVESISWQDAITFCGKMTERERIAGRLPFGYEYRLPTEAEWEFCCRAGAIRNCKGDLDSMAWFKNNSDNRTHPVAKKSANAWGFHDMQGSVWEWCYGWYGDYSSGVVENPKGAGRGQFRVLRGGCWASDVSNCSVTSRSYDSPSYSEHTLGFRVALAPKL